MVMLPQRTETMPAEPVAKPAEPIKIKEKYSLSATDTAAFFQELAQELGSTGVIEMGTQDQSVKVTIGKPVLLEIGYKEGGKGKKTLKIKVEMEEIQTIVSGTEGTTPI